MVDYLSVQVGVFFTGVDNSFVDTKPAPSLESGMNRSTFPPKTSLEDGVPPHFLLLLIAFI